MAEDSFGLRRSGISTATLRLVALALMAALLLAGAAREAHAGPFASYAEFERAYNEAMKNLAECRKHRDFWQEALGQIKSNPDNYRHSDYLAAKRNLEGWDDCLAEARRKLELLKKNMPARPSVIVPDPGGKGDDEKADADRSDTGTRRKAQGDEGWTEEEFELALRLTEKSGHDYELSAQESEYSWEEFEELDVPPR